MSPHDPQTNGTGHQEVTIVTTQDEDGETHVFEKIDEVEIDGKEYALLIYRGNDEAGAAQKAAADDAETDEEDEVVVMRIAYEDGQEVYENIDDEDEFSRVVEHIELMQVDDDAFDEELQSLLQHIEPDDDDEDDEEEDSEN